MICEKQEWEDALASQGEMLGIETDGDADERG